MYRPLEKGEIIQDGDEADASRDMFCPPLWQPVNPQSIGKPAPDPQYPAHTQYRRRVQRWKTDLRERQGTHLELSIAMTYYLCAHSEPEEFEAAMRSIFHQMEHSIRKKRKQLQDEMQTGT
jgi:hypothetical protein